MVLFGEKSGAMVVGVWDSVFLMTNGTENRIAGSFVDGTPSPKDGVPTNGGQIRSLRFPHPGVPTQMWTDEFTYVAFSPTQIYTSIHVNN